jgi:Xaa-Pro aminopeptidase
MTKVTAEVKTHLGGSVTVKPYDAIFTDLADLSNQLVESEGKGGDKLSIWMDYNKCNLALYQAVADSKFVLEKDSPIALMKAKKNPVININQSTNHISPKMI